MMKTMPQYQEMVRSNPQLEQMMSNPEMIRQMFSKENLQLARDLEAAGLGGMGGMDGMGGMGGMGGSQGFGGLPRQQPMTPDEIRNRYPNEIKQLEEIGIRVDDQVLMLLHRFNGNVEWTLNYLYECHVCFYFYDPLLSFVPTDDCARIHGIGCQLYVDSRSSQQ